MKLILFYQFSGMPISWQVKESGCLHIRADTLFFITRLGAKELGFSQEAEDA